MNHSCVPWLSVVPCLLFLVLFHATLMINKHICRRWSQNEIWMTNVYTKINLKLNSQLISSVAVVFHLIRTAELYISHENVAPWSSFLGIREYFREPRLDSFTISPSLFRTALVYAIGHCKWRDVSTIPGIIDVFPVIILER